MLICVCFSSEHGICCDDQSVWKKKGWAETSVTTLAKHTCTCVCSGYRNYWFMRYFIQCKVFLTDGFKICSNVSGFVQESGPVRVYSIFSGTMWVYLLHHDFPVWWTESSETVRKCISSLLKLLLSYTL